MKKKVGILTFHNTRNAGAALQSYALEKILSNQDVTVKVINYQNENINSRYAIKKLSEIKQGKELIKYILSNKYVIKRQALFSDFYNKHQNFSRVYTAENIQESNIEFDYFVTGSDQVWNFSHTNNDWNYVLDFVRDDKRKASYAASLGIIDFKSEDYLHWKKSLSSFTVLAIREQDGVKAVKELINTSEVNHVLDPTLLLDLNAWNSIIPSNRIIDEKYILIYTMAESPELFAKAENLSRKTGFKLIYLNESWKKKAKVSNVREFGPIEFLHYFRDAEYIFTTSFHGVAFSINFNKEFYFDLNKEKYNFNSRIESLIDLLELKNRNIAIYSSERIDWKSVNSLIEIERKSSLDVVKKIVD